MMTMNEYLKLAKTTILRHGGSYKFHLANDDDAIGEVASAMMMADHTYKGDKGAQPTTWRINQGRFRIKKLVRKLKSLPKTMDISRNFDVATPEQSLERYEEIIDNCSNLITEKQRKYIDAVYRDGYTMEEVANQYGISKQAVSFTINEAIKKIRKHGITT